MRRLKSHLNCPPGSFFYRIQFRNGVETVFYGDKGEPDVYTFGPDPIPDTVAQALSEFRKANLLPGADEGVCLAAVDEYTCTRLGGMSRFCWESTQTFAEVAATIKPKRCKSCGHRVA